MTNPLDDARLDWTFLRSHDFDEAYFRAAQARIARGELTAASSVVTGRIEPVADVVDVDYDAPDVALLRARGEAALRGGKVAHVVLNGGMATRFGGVVKGVVEVYEGETFISLKAKDALHARQRFGAAVPLVLMDSFATHEATLAHVAARGRFGLPEADLLFFQQSVSIRMNEDGSLFIGDDGKPSYHAPGHGDFFRAIRNSGVLAQLRDRGVEHLLFSNVDNLGATVDPVIVGHHLAGARPMTAEITLKQRTASGAWDKGGAPAVVDGRRQLVEGFRFPADFPQETLPDFSTNNMVFSAAAIDRDVPLERHVVKKAVDGRPALQLESITCEASGVYEADEQPLFPMTLLRVPREGPHGRFFPVKEPVDLETSRAKLKARLEAGWR
jgi:UTP--glucose-1-phosphate uridylyltransferase